MATSYVKISQLTDVGTSILANTMVPIVDQSNLTLTTERMSFSNMANVLLGNSGNVYSAAREAVYCQNVINSNQPNITNVGTLSNLSVTGNAVVGNNISVVGNVTVGTNIVATGTVSASNITITGNVLAGNIVAVGDSTVTNLSVLASSNLGGLVIGPVVAVANTVATITHTADVTINGVTYKLMLST